MGLYITTPKALLKYKSFYSNKTLPYIMPSEKSIDIDNELDFRLAKLIKNKIIKKENKK
jgi:CMP-N,N'-diacetyllegionaminic acid synthase